MAEFVFSAFADEIESDFEKQLEALDELGIRYIELRGVNGKSFTVLSDQEIATVRKQLDNHGIKVWALGSPIGKIKTNDDFEAHKKLLERVINIGSALGTKRIRVFSFYREDGITDDEYENKVFHMMGELLHIADEKKFILCHENEKDIYGCSPERVLKLATHFCGRLKVILDNGNYPFAGFSAENAYSLLKKYIDYFHVKDATNDGIIVPPGEGNAFLKETFCAVNTDRIEPVVLTMEPHLMMFDGLSSFSNLDDIKHKYTFDSPFQAFESATNDVRRMLSEL